MSLIELLQIIIIACSVQPTDALESKCQMQLMDCVEQQKMGLLETEDKLNECLGRRK